MYDHGPYARPVFSLHVFAPLSNQRVLYALARTLTVSV